MVPQMLVPQMLGQRLVYRRLSAIRLTECQTRLAALAAASRTLVRQILYYSVAEEGSRPLSAAHGKFCDCVRTIAAPGRGDNLLIYRYGTGPLGRLVGIVSNHTSPTFGFWLVLGPLFCLLAVAFSPLAAFLIRRFQQGREIAPGGKRRLRRFIVPSQGLKGRNRFSARPNL